MSFLHRIPRISRALRFTVPRLIPSLVYPSLKRSHNEPSILALVLNHNLVNGIEVVENVPHGLLPILVDHDDVIHLFLDELHGLRDAFENLHLIRVRSLILDLNGVDLFLEGILHLGSVVALVDEYPLDGLHALNGFVLEVPVDFLLLFFKYFELLLEGFDHVLLELVAQFVVLLLHFSRYVNLNHWVREFFLVFSQIVSMPPIVVDLLLKNGLLVLSS